MTRTGGEPSDRRSPADPQADPEAVLTPEDRETLSAIRAADGLADLVELTGTADAHAAYLSAKERWRDLQGRILAAAPTPSGVPGTTVMVGDTAFRIHGITHAGTDAERAYIRDHVAAWTDAGHDVFCEQGIRRMYFDDRPAVREMDDYRWAMARCEALEGASHVAELVDQPFDGLSEELDSVTDRFREATFELVDAGRELYGDRFASALGDVAAGLLTSHEALATGRDFESFSLTERAATDPETLTELQRYYRQAFLPQPIEREWLGRHDPELEIVTHARNERLADYAVYHHDDAPTVHLVVGAAHQPGVAFYLARIRDGERAPDRYEPVA